MHIRPADKAEVLNTQLDKYADRAAAALGISITDFGHPGVATAGQMVVVGRIVADQDGLMDEKSGTCPRSLAFLLETSRQIGSGHRVPLGMAGDQVSVFPGQMVVLEGSNPDGTCFHVKRQLFPKILEHEALNRRHVQHGAFSMVFAAGPFTLDDPTAARLDMGPFERLLNFAFERRPHVLLLLGPFVDADNSLLRAGKVQSTPEEFFLREFIGRIRLLTSRLSHLRVLIIPATRDLVADPVFPQPAFTPELIADQPNILLLPNPATLTLNGLHLAVSSSDVLLPLGVEEHCRIHGSDRMHRLSSYLLQQDSFWPLHPAPPGANIDYNLLSSLALGHLPDIVLLSSQLRYFVRSLDETALVVNAGQFCRKQAHGTASVLTVSSCGEKRVDFYQF